MITLNTREELLDLLPKGLKIAEVGVFRGEFSEKIIEKCEPSEIFLVDLWEGVMTSGDKDGKNIKKITDMFKVFQEEVLPKFSKVNGAEIHRTTSDKFFDGVKEDYFDAIYIDAAHTYRAVKKDLENARKAVKHNGVIMGHDYHEKKFPGVYRAVNEFITKHDLKISYVTNDGMPSFYIVNTK
jgi:hypothetical protein